MGPARRVVAREGEKPGPYFLFTVGRVVSFVPFVNSVYGCPGFTRSENPRDAAGRQEELPA